MDIRIVNTCNNDCLYCLEQSYRSRDPFISKEKIFEKIDEIPEGDSLTFYGGNPLLHPNLFEFIAYGKMKKIASINILSNTFGIDEAFLERMQNQGLTGFGFYFHTNHVELHSRINGAGITLPELKKNITLLQRSSLQLRAIIHINGLNIDSLYRDIAELFGDFGIKKFEFINYFPFDRPYEKYHHYLMYSSIQKVKQIGALFLVIKKLNLEAKFVKFPRVFFGNWIEYYSFENGIVGQIGTEDYDRINTGDGTPPFCYLEKRCAFCFLQDYCQYYDREEYHHHRTSL